MGERAEIIILRFESAFKLTFQKLSNPGGILSYWNTITTELSLNLYNNDINIYSLNSACILHCALTEFIQQ